ncbi:MAG TPA: ATP-grasp domain-containing protein [Bacteroidales bacterium]|nr:ATP-grasp domain-containing protein [Bacteroidales bacterium]
MKKQNAAPKLPVKRGSTVLILYNKLSENAKDDEADVIEQVNLVTGALEKLEYRVAYLEIDLNLETAIDGIRKARPAVIFNLAETIGNKGEFAFIATSVLSYTKIPYTGSHLIPMFFCSNKYLAKKELNRMGIRTPGGWTLYETDKLQPDKKYLIKPIWEEGSLELDEDCVFMGSDQAFIERIGTKSPDHYFIEEFIDGREFNISILFGQNGPEVLPLAEMTFCDFPGDKPKMMGYKSKWDENSWEYTHTRRTFRPAKGDGPLRKELEDICKKCWHGLGLKGYVRVDFRVSEQSVPLVIDINLNPCLSGSGGFMAASKKRGLAFEEVIARVLADAVRR